MATSAADLLLVTLNPLAPDEQEEAYAKITDARITRLAGVDS